VTIKIIHDRPGNRGIADLSGEHYFLTMQGIERRAAPRIAPPPITYVRVIASSTSQPGTHETCPIINVSETGMLFRSTKIFRPCDLLQLTFTLPNSSIAIRTESTVIHASDTVGVQFRNLAIAEHQILRHYIASTLAS
jgi:hypothetical protein